MDCDDIAWLIDILGTTNLLAYVITPAGRVPDYPVDDISERGPRRSAFNGSGPFPDGLYFISGHWYSCLNNIRKDSYSMNYQIKGTAHFCQTFAAMIFMGEDQGKLVPGNYVANIEAALDFWINIFENDVRILDFFLRNIRSSSYALKGEMIAGTKYPLSKISASKLFGFLKNVRANASSFTGCMQTF